MIHKKQFNTRIIFSVMVPVSIAGFSVGILSVGGDMLSYFHNITAWDYVSGT